MRPLISEFSFGYALTEELASGRFGDLVGAPIFPSLIQEGQPGGGYDVQLPRAGTSLFLQFKLSDHLKRRSAKERHLFNIPYYRMHIRPARFSDQHAMLMQWEQQGEEVYYVAPNFYKTEQLNEYYTNNSVSDNSCYFRPSEIGELPDDKDHHISFELNSPTAYFCSGKPHPIKAKINKQEFVRRESEHFVKRKKKVDKAFFARINAMLLDRGHAKSKMDELLTKRFGSRSRRTKVQEALLAAFLSRAILNAELLVVADPSDVSRN